MSKILAHLQSRCAVGIAKLREKFLTNESTDVSVCAEMIES
jgi:hypothetical protein